MVDMCAIKTFGDFFRLNRVNLGFTLRKFCEQYGFDPGNISKLERNVLSPSIDEEKLKGYARALKLRPDSTEWVTFFDLAHLAKGTLPRDIQSNDQVSSFLPAFYRSVRGEKLTKEKMLELLQLLEQANSTENESQ